MRRMMLLPALAALLAVGFVAPTATGTAADGVSEDAVSQDGVSQDGLSQAPGDLPETNPVGTLGWLPPTANEDPAAGFGNHRLIVTYDHSLNDSGEQTELITKGAFGMRIFTTALANGSGQELPLTMVDHSSHVSSLDDAGVPAEVAGEVDPHFMGVSGDVRDADCALLHDDDGAEGFSAAYTTTRTTPPDYAPTECELVTGEVTDADGNVTGLEVTTYVPGFWIDVNWPTSSDPLSSGNGHYFAELWYGALVDTAGDGSGEWFTQVDSQGQSQSVGGPMQIDERLTVTAPPGAFAEPCYPNAPAGVPDSHVERTVDLSGYEGDEIRVSLYPKGDWDLFIVGPSGTQVSGAGGFVGFEETAVTGFTPGEWTIRACNFAGEPLADVYIHVR